MTHPIRGRGPTNSAAVALLTLFAAMFCIVMPTRAADSTDFVAELRARGIVDPMEDPPDELLHSADLRVRIVFSAGPFRRHSDGTYWRDSLVSTEALVEQARGSTDPVVLDLLSVRCSSAPGCDIVDLLRRWTEADRQNQLAWLRLAGALKARGDTVGARDAFLTASRASVWHEHYDDVVRLVLAAMPKDLPDVERLAAMHLSRSVAGMTISSRELQVLGVYCKEADAATRAACARIVSTMVRDTGTLMPLTSAPAFAARAGLSDLEVSAYEQKSDAIHWALLQVVAEFGSAATSPDDVAAALRAQQRLFALGERGAAERYLIDHHIAERDAAARYVTTLTPYQLKHRAELRSAR